MTNCLRNKRNKLTEALKNVTKAAEDPTNQTRELNLTQTGRGQ